MPAGWLSCVSHGDEARLQVRRPALMASIGRPPRRPQVDQPEKPTLHPSVKTHRLPPLRRQAGLPTRARLQSEALALLRGDGCPACRFLDTSESSFFTWFRIESYNDPTVIERLQAGLGMCPRHTRRLLCEMPASALTTVYRYVVGSAARSLGELRQRGPCPACEREGWAASHVLRSLLDLLSNAAGREAYLGGDGLCLPHLLQELPESGPYESELLAALTVRRLAEAGAGKLGALLGGFDPDARLREQVRAALPESGYDQAGATLADLSARLAVEACPLCLSAGLAERRYLTWIVEEWQRARTSLRPDASHLCSQHLNDIAAQDAVVGHELAEMQREYWLGALADFRERLGRLPPRSPLVRLRALPAAWKRFHAPEGQGRYPAGRLPSARLALLEVGRTRKDALERARRPLLWLRPCPACSAAGVVEERQTDLLLRACRDSEVGERYARSHGICVHHLLRVRGRQRAPALLGEVAAARLGVLAWELEEAGRKSSWSYRHEPAGPEASAWLRAPALLDGRTYLGGPPFSIRPSPSRPE